MESKHTDSESDLAFSTLDLTGVNFSDEDTAASTEDNDDVALHLEKKMLGGQAWKSLSAGKSLDRGKTGGIKSEFLSKAIAQLDNGEYIKILNGETAGWLLAARSNEAEECSIWNRIRANLFDIDCISSLIEAEIFAVAALNVFLQLNYTGPLFEDPNALNGIDPHPILASSILSSQQDTNAEIGKSYHNAVLAELAVDGYWPCQIAKVPYLLLLARCILLTLSDPERKCWNHEEAARVSSDFCKFSSTLFGAPIWSARAALAHERLLLSREPTITLWEELKSAYQKSILLVENSGRQLQATVFLEYGLAFHHFNNERKGKEMFKKAMETSGLSVEVSGALGKRTKFQTKATAQMVVKAASAGDPENALVQDKENKKEEVKSQLVDHADDTILLERVRFEKNEENEIDDLTVLDQAIILAFCLDVKNSNPADGLTAEEMSAYLARVLCHHDDWTVYSAALLERAWLEFEGNHTKERAILQLQALADQHTNRLTITQSTRKSVEESSLVQERLKNVHSIMYPPRWDMLRDVAERYAELGIVTSAAEIFTEIEFWDEVVDCYRRAGKEKRAEEIVRDCLSKTPTPRMWVALGDICDDISYYERAITLSNGRFCQAYVSLGENLFRRGHLLKASENYRHALKLRPLLPNVWFRLGTISMQVGDWDAALRAFSEVVQQQPDESEAWANVAAVHQHEKRPAEAYPALVESLKHNRNNWRVWINKLYLCLDLEKFDEAIQACSVLMDLKRKMASQGIPDLEEKCVRGIVGGILDAYGIAREVSDQAALNSARRSLSRLHSLLERIRASSSEPWVFETMAYFHEQIGQDSQVFENLMKEYRFLTSVRAWEKDDYQVRKVCQVVSQIVHYQRSSREELVKSKFLVSGTLKRVEKARAGVQDIPNEIDALKASLKELTNELENTQN